MMKKIGAIVLAVVMIMAMGSVAFAAGDEGRTVAEKKDTYTGSNASEATNMATTTAIPLTKSIVFVNANGSAVYEPNISFAYAVESASIAESTYTVVDGKTPDPVTAYVHPGPANGVTGTTIAFGVELGGTATSAVTTNANGVDVERTGSLGLDISKFSSPGVYRYKISETPTPDVTTVGLTARTSDYNSVRFLDVYIHRNASDVLEMYGAVIFKSTASTAGQDNITTGTTKTTGYEPSVASGELKDDTTVDRYTTYDFAVKKTVNGSMADKNHDFPFYVNIIYTITGAKYTYFNDPGTSTGAAEIIADAAITKGSDSSSSSLALKDGEYVKFVGVPSNQTTELAVVVKEFNDTVDQYTPKVSATKGTITLTSTNAATGEAMTASTGSDATSSFTVKTNDVVDQIITIENNLTEISPTGVVLRVAPYVLILAAGIALLLISRRRKAVEEE